MNPLVTASGEGTRHLIHHDSFYGNRVFCEDSATSGAVRRRGIASGPETETVLDRRDGPMRSGLDALHRRARGDLVPVTVVMGVASWQIQVPPWRPPRRHPEDRSIGSRAPHRRRRSSGSAASDRIRPPPDASAASSPPNLVAVPCRREGWITSRNEALLSRAVRSIAVSRSKVAR